MSNQSVVMNVRGQSRRVSLERDLGNNRYRARVREPGTGNSIRGEARKNVKGVWSFHPTNPSALS